MRLKLNFDLENEFLPIQYRKSVMSFIKLSLSKYVIALASSPFLIASKNEVITLSGVLLAANTFKPNPKTSIKAKNNFFILYFPLYIQIISTIIAIYCLIKYYFAIIYIK